MLTPTTMAVVAVGALLFFGPKRLPELARSLGKSLGEFQEGAKEAKETLASGITTATDPVEKSSK